MKSRFRLFRRGQTFYAHDGVTGQQTSLRTTDKGEATALLHSKNEAYRQPNLNLQLARTYLSASDPQTMKRTWQTVMTEMSATKKGPTKIRYERATRDTAFDLIEALESKGKRTFEPRPRHGRGARNSRAGHGKRQLQAESLIAGGISSFPQ